MARDALLEECNASLLCEAFDAAGVESVELMSECAFEELVSCIGEETPRGKLNAIQTRQLRKAFDLACARGSGPTAESSVNAVDGVNARPGEPAGEPDADEDRAKEPSAAEPAPKSAKAAKKARQKAAKQVHVATGVAPASAEATAKEPEVDKPQAPPKPRSPSKSTAPLASVKELLGSSSKGGGRFEALRVDDDETAVEWEEPEPLVPVWAKGLRHLTELFERFGETMACCETFLETLVIVLGLVNDTSGMTLELRAEAVEQVLNTLEDDCRYDVNRYIDIRALRMQVGQEWKAFLKAERDASEGPPVFAKHPEHLSAESSTSGKGEVSMATATGAAIGAAMAAASSSGDKEASEQPDAARERVAKVAEDPAARAKLAELKAMGEEALASGEAPKVKSFLRAQSDAQVRFESLANLLHTSKIPSPTGMFADPDATLALLKGGGTRDARQGERAEVARAAGKVQKHIIAAIESNIENRLKGGDAARLASAVFHGQLLGYSSTSGSFQLTEFNSDRALARLVAGTSSQTDAKALLESTMNAIKIAFKLAHPRDVEAEETIIDVSSESTGANGDKEYHNQTFGELFKRFAMAFVKWQEGTFATMPTLSSAWAKASANPLLKDLLAGHTEREERTRAAEEACKKAEEAAAKAIKDAAEATKIAERAGRSANVPRQRLKVDPDRPASGGEEKPFVLRGKERAAKRNDKFAKVRELKKAQEEASAAASSGGSDAAAKKAAAAALQQAVDAIDAELKAKA